MIRDLGRHRKHSDQICDQIKRKGDASLTKQQPGHKEDRSDAKPDQRQTHIDGRHRLVNRFPTGGFAARVFAPQARLLAAAHACMVLCALDERHPRGLICIRIRDGQCSFGDRRLLRFRLRRFRGLFGSLSGLSRLCRIFVSYSRLVC